MSKKESSKLSKKIDHICRVIFLTEEGKPKSATLLYAFCLALVFIIAYFIAYFLFVDTLEEWFASINSQTRNMLEIILPGVLASIPCSLLSYAFKEKLNLVLAGYAWMAIVFILIAIMMVFYCDWSEGPTDYFLFMEVLGGPFLVSIISGWLFSYLIYRSRK